MDTIMPRGRSLARRRKGQDGSGSAELAAARPKMSKRDPGKSQGDRRLTRLDWIDAGQDVLRDAGIAGLKLAQLTRRLGVSTGSFYHHFNDFDDYLGALADHYSLERVKGELATTLAGGPGPLARMRRLARLSIRQRTFELDHAMRIWATMDPRAEKTVREAEAQVLAFLADAFGELGFGPTDSMLRARMLLSCNVAPLGLPPGEERRAFFKDCLRLLSGRQNLEEPASAGEGSGAVRGSCTSRVPTDEVSPTSRKG
ncbi:TetR/AcrR family transcriptional regulator [Chelatococcus reniformis]|uniref:HTH tetR-type domain-containing protein n=1 Tax=Chelatococcus reniformis TaxID=1494448 RepID=A0A916UH62_9HYPH|nr:TetR/AcrR family transcriptional regulator [Chelatococcus reniformis]GGC72866.1 hypothetical protein GCM10010994_34040 [Chelatococcus reniformis]